MVDSPVADSTLTTCRRRSFGFAKNLSADGGGAAKTILCAERLYHPASPIPSSPDSAHDLSHALTRSPRAHARAGGFYQWHSCVRGAGGAGRAAVRRLPLRHVGLWGRALHHDRWTVRRCRLVVPTAATPGSGRAVDSPGDVPADVTMGWCGGAAVRCVGARKLGGAGRRRRRRRRYPFDYGYHGGVGPANPRNNALLMKRLQAAKYDTPDYMSAPLLALLQRTIQDSPPTASPSVSICLSGITCADVCRLFAARQVDVAQRYTAVVAMKDPWVLSADWEEASVDTLVRQFSSGPIATIAPVSHAAACHV
jgi:hypothetical protein